MLTNKVVVITGASSGIGAILAEQLSRNGAHVILTGRSEERLREAGKKLSGKYDVIQMDIKDMAQVQAAFDTIYENHGRIDVLVNNAGYGVFEAFLETSEEQFEDMMDVNYMGIVRCTQAALPGMLKQSRGQIVNIASIAGKMGIAKSTAYASTKHAVLGLTNSLRQELRGTGITVSSVNPGPINTPFFQQADPSGRYVKNVGWFMMKPEYVVSQILKLIVKQKEEINLPKSAAAGMKIYQLFPRLADRLLHRWMDLK
ncbi:SDR family NAD(P)-dependent oxidoreductase [Paenibacillus lemnae]|uniref:SDR family oxidoreductase n=1 Tax=Paenibacillus lemnae TaxID=1330551 RepID=A0A848M738_PAELE|nr:SDR family oxidoreductase [Paenibacillus lemnae]